ncbi:MAG: hypothetical protein IT423_22920, partial [Pirellulaceae bacterium]|nr:hypothetical protein [Pirellulaceae bacterium]
PDDEAALRCCEWIIVHCRAHDRDGDLYEAENAAWQIVASNQSDTTRLPALCLEAAKSPSPVREKFLRSLPDDYRQPVEVHAYSFLALAELLAKKAEFKPDSSNRDDRASTKLREYFANVEPNQLRRESAEIFQHVLDHYSEVPYRFEAQSDHECETLGEYAAMRLGEIKDSQLARRALPNLIEMPTQRFDHLSGN